MHCALSILWASAAGAISSLLFGIMCEMVEAIDVVGYYKSSRDGYAALWMHLVRARQVLASYFLLGVIIGLMIGIPVTLWEHTMSSGPHESTVGCS